jgi:glycosyltransferase involved in cell wall biosynthesis
MSMPGSPLKRVSAIIPTHNRGHLIRNAVESIERQDYRNLEIIIVDDRSTDDTREVVEHLQQDNPLLRFFPNERSKGPSGARNTGLLNSTGDYISFLDSDDIWLENHVAQGVHVLEDNPKIDVLFGDFKVVDQQTGLHRFNFFEQKHLLPRLSSLNLSGDVKMIQDNVFKALVQENFFHLGSSIIRRQVIDGLLFNEKISYAEDRDFAIRLYKERNACFAYRTSPVFILYQHNDSLMSGNNVTRERNLCEAHLELFKGYLANYVSTDEERSLLRKLIAQAMLTHSYLDRIEGSHVDSLRYALGSASYYVSSIFFREMAKVLIAMLFRRTKKCVTPGN